MSRTRLTWPLVNPPEANRVRVELAHGLPLDVEAVGEAVQQLAGERRRGDLREGLDVDEPAPEELDQQAEGDHRQNAGTDNGIRMLPKNDPTGRNGVGDHAGDESNLPPIHLPHEVRLLTRRLRPVFRALGDNKAVALFH